MKKLASALVCAGLVLTGCSGVNEITLPGGADVGDNPYTVKASFDNVLNLVEQSTVKVNDVPIGRVTDVDLPSDGWNAQVTMLINGDVDLPADAHAMLRQSSLLGEKFVELMPPPGTKGGASATGGRLADGAVIPAARTNRNPETEEVLGALSMLLNGGGIAQIRTITTELNKALDGNEPQIRSLIKRLTTLSSSLDSNKKGITDAIDGLNRLSSTLRARTAQIDTALDDLAPGLKTLAEQRGALVRMLSALDELSGVAVTTINRSKDDMIADLKALEPTLRKLADSGKDLPGSLEVLLTYPFTDAVIPAIKGDYLNTYIAVTAPPGTEIIPPIDNTKGGGGGQPQKQGDKSGDKTPGPLPTSVGTVAPPVVGEGSS